jgi:hypothetical protein
MVQVDAMSASITYACGDRFLVYFLINCRSSKTLSQLKVEEVKNLSLDGHHDMLKLRHEEENEFNSFALYLVP